MAYDDITDEEPHTAEEMLEVLQEALDDMQHQLRKVNETLNDSGAGIRMEVAQNRRELAQMKVILGRLQSRFDNQLMTLAIANVASGVGVAALVLAATHTFN